MSTRSNVLRLAVFGLLITPAPRWVQRVLGYILLGVAIAVIWIVLGVTARGEPVHTERQIETALALNIFDATCRPISDTAKTAAWIILNSPRLEGEQFEFAFRKTNEWYALLDKYGKDAWCKVAEDQIVDFVEGKKP